jgi:hypothetical protein
VISQPSGGSTEDPRALELGAGVVANLERRAQEIQQVLRSEQLQPNSYLTND